MIQRIQTVYLPLSIVSVALMAFVPFANFEANGQVAVFASFVFNFTEGVFPARPGVAWGGIFFALVSIAFAVRIIFDYNNRRRQARWCTYQMLFTALLWVTMSTYAAVFMLKAEASALPSVAFAMPLVAIVLTLLAKKAILSDERLVRSSERLR